MKAKKIKKSDKPETKVSYLERRNGLYRYAERVTKKSPLTRLQDRLKSKFGSEGRVLKPKRLRL